MRRYATYDGPRACSVWVELIQVRDNLTTSSLSYLRRRVSAQIEGNTEFHSLISMTLKLVLSNARMIEGE